MATRLYFPDGAVAPITPPAPTANWAHINSVLAPLLSVVDASALATTAYTPDAADDITDKAAHHRQYISPCLSAQALSGNVTGQFQCSEAHANNNLFLTLKILLCDRAGASTLATLLAITRATSLELTTTLTNRTFPSTALTPFTCADGDRLVVEVGLAGNITTAAGGVQGHNGSIRWGCSAAGGDLAANETEAGTTFRPWVEFASTFTWEWERPTSLRSPDFLHDGLARPVAAGGLY